MSSELSARVCKNDMCGLTFTPTRSNQVFHNPACGKKAHNRRAAVGPLPARLCDSCTNEFIPRRDAQDTCTSCAKVKREVSVVVDPAETDDPVLLRSMIAAAQAKEAAAKNKVRHVVAAVRDAVSEAMLDLKINPPKARRIEPRSTHSPEIAIVHASDWQLGKVTATYDSVVCEERVQLFAEKVIEITEIQNAHHPVREARVYITGDIVEGEGIFPTQGAEIDSGIYRQVMVNGVRILGNFILDLLGYFDKVHVVGVIGNHGDIRLRGSAPDPESNTDRMLYEAVRLMLMGPDRFPSELARSGRLTWSIPQGKGQRNWYAVDRIGEFGFLMFHGDQIRGQLGIPWYGLARKVWGWLESIPEPWDYGFFGHHHTPAKVTLNKHIMYANGSTESDNAYAQEQLAACGQPMQFLAFVHPQRGITAEYPVYLADATPSSLRYEAWRLGQLEEY